MEETISLKEIFQTLKQRWRMLVLIPLLAMLAGALVSSFVLTPMYERSTEILVNQTESDGQLTQNNVRTNIEVIGTYTNIIESSRILAPVAENSEIGYSVSELKNMMSVTAPNNSQVMSVTIEADDPYIATLIVNEIAEVFVEDLPTIYTGAENVNILTAAEVGENPSPSSPNTILNIAIAFVVGLMGAVGLAFLFEYLDTTIKTEKDIENILNLPVLGAVSTMDGMESAKKTS
ncbi:capsular polysaccharide biosynthesis protein [Alkalihalobacillus xiaoxiensis]|uniref:Capsular polysaccharide biosynthesis protein n=1 Tax=Shouchella xiaoxiensis TaxID=766895 RepID=A0ABS2SWH2_9BACI|nr:Wzz/FepE/Etk N-terminal domain-containing protein [Shouchella xiaoxiensis]MBM7839521.1 capsular polysaccharide biosynthesis protein [Shouchella xiaoxiensis]